MTNRSPAAEFADAAPLASAGVAAGQRRRRAVVRALLTAAPFALACAPVAHAAEPPHRTEAVDLDLLEFLGSDDAADPELRDYLLQQPSAPRRAETSTPPAGKPAPGPGSTPR